MGWSVHHGRGRLLVFTNETGATVTDAEVRLQGRAVGGMIGQRIWSLKLAEMADGDAVEAPFKLALGAQSDPPRMEIQWTDSNDERWEAAIDLPI